MKVLLIISFLAALGCASVGANKPSNLSFEKMRSLTIGKSSVQDIIKSFGLFDENIDREDSYTLVYNDPRSLGQRMSLIISKDSQVLVGYLWIPKENEEEITLGSAKMAFKDANFKENSISEASPHFVSEIVNFVDYSSGATIRYNKTNNVVEAIGVYDSKRRLPTSTKKSTSIPYTIGDELQKE